MIIQDWIATDMKVLKKKVGVVLFNENINAQLRSAVLYQEETRRQGVGKLFWGKVVRGLGDEE